MPSTAESAPSRRRRRRRLSRDRILEAAVSLIERDGPAALSMRRLGSELGVEGMALYHHFDGRDELLSAIGDRILEPLQRLESTENWRDACWRFATALRNVAVAHPATFRLLGLRPLDTRVSLRPVELLLGLLVAEGFTPPDALAIYRATVSYARGYALGEATGFTVDAARTVGRQRLAALPPDEFPVLAGRGHELARLDADSAFERGLRALLDGLADPN